MNGSFPDREISAPLPPTGSGAASHRPARTLRHPPPARIPADRRTPRPLDRPRTGMRARMPPVGPSRSAAVRRRPPANDARPLSPPGILVREVLTEIIPNKPPAKIGAGVNRGPPPSAGDSGRQSPPEHSCRGGRGRGGTTIESGGAMVRRPVQDRRVRGVTGPQRRLPQGRLCCAVAGGFPGHEGPDARPTGSGRRPVLPSRSLACTVQDPPPGRRSEAGHLLRRRRIEFNVQAATDGRRP